MMSVFYICGPTASGKSSLAIALANELNGHSINADAYQVYQGLPILTSCPSADEYAQAPHHLYEFLAVGQEFDAAQYRQLALAKIEELKSIEVYLYTNKVKICPFELLLTIFMTNSITNEL